MQVGFPEFLKHVGSLIKLLSLFKLQNSLMEPSFTFTLKSPMKNKIVLFTIVLI